MQLFAADGVFNGHGDVVVSGLGHVGHLALDEAHIGGGLHLVQNLHVAARSAQVDVEHRDLGLGVLLADVLALLESGHTADVGAVVQVVLVTGTGALHESDAFGTTAVGRTDDLAAGGAEGGGQAFELHVGHAVLDLAGAQVGQVGDVVGLPAGGHHDGAHIEFDLAGGFVLVQELLAGDAGGVSLAQGVGVQHEAVGERKRHGFVQSLALGQPEVEFVGHGAFQAGSEEGEVHVVGGHLAGLDAHGGGVVTLTADQLGHFGHGEEFDAGVLPDALELDFQTAGGGTKFGEIFVELGHTAAQVGRLFHDIHIVAQFRRFDGGSKACKAAAHDENGVGHPGYPPALQRRGPSAGRRARLPGCMGLPGGAIESQGPCRAAHIPRRGGELACRTPAAPKKMGWPRRPPQGCSSAY